MIKPVLVDEDIRWECVNCGRCCFKIGDEFSLHLFGVKTDNGKCVKFDKRCTIYNERPLGCKMYPFYPDWERLKKGEISFNVGGLQIDSDCSGFGSGDLVVGNKKLFKKLKKVALELKEKMIENRSGKIKELFM
ncbi:MAG: YkgJ family cysteine cluster protein [archaeon]